MKVTWWHEGDMVADMVAGMEVVDMEVDIVGDMVATKDFVEPKFVETKLFWGKAYPGLRIF